MNLKKLTFSTKLTLVRPLTAALGFSFTSIFSSAVSESVSGSTIFFFLVKMGIALDSETTVPNATIKPFRKMGSLIDHKINVNYRTLSSRVLEVVEL